MIQTTPVIFLAFANDEEHSLRQLAKEHDELKEIFQQAMLEGKCQVITRADATPDKVIKVFHENQSRIRIFHYGGHSDKDTLFLSRDFPEQDG